MEKIPLKNMGLKKRNTQRENLYGINIPSAYIKHGQIDPDKEYMVILIEQNEANINEEKILEIMRE